MPISKILSNNKTYTINTLSLFLLNGFNFLLSIIILPKLIDNFGINGWGKITFAQIIVNYFIWFIDWSFPQYACKQISINNSKIEKRNEIFVNTRTAQLILFMISSTLLVFYGLIFSQNKLIFIYSVLILFGNFLQSYWYLNGKEKIYETAFFQLLNRLIFALFVFKLITKDSDVSIYFFYFGISNTITGLLVNLRIVFKYKESIKIGNIKRSIKLIKNSFMLFNSSIIGNITNSSIPFLIVSFYSIESLGIYNIADRIKNISIQIINPLSNSIFPRMSKSYNENKEIANKKLINFILLILTLGSLIFILLNSNIDLIINYFIKENIVGIKNVVRVLTFSFLINIMYESIMNQYLVINNLFIEINKIKLIILISSIILGIPLIFFKGILGAAITNLIYEVIGLLYAISIFIKTKNKKTLHKI